MHTQTTIANWLERHDWLITEESESGPSTHRQTWWETLSPSAESVRFVFKRDTGELLYAKVERGR